MKKHRFRAMTWEEVCDTQKLCSPQCPVFKSPMCGVSTRPAEPARLPNGKYILKEVKE